MRQQSLPVECFFTDAFGGAIFLHRPFPLRHQSIAIVGSARGRPSEPKQMTSATLPRAKRESDTRCGDEAACQSRFRRGLEIRSITSDQITVHPIQS
jgi:hypothetical protein